MIETVLAVAVLSMGILSLFILFSGGLDLGIPATADTRTAMFADNTLEGLRAESDLAASEDRWIRFWEDFSTGTTNVAAASPYLWTNPVPVIIGDNRLHTNIFKAAPLRTGTSISNVVELALRYRLKAEFVPEHAVETNNVAVTLKVWPGEEGSTNDSDANIFYSWFNINGGL